MHVNEGLKSSKRIVIYGARLIALETMLRLLRVCPEKIWGCVVSSMQGNPKEMAGYPVCALGESEGRIGIGWLRESYVILALGNAYHEEVVETLGKAGAQNCISYDELFKDETVLLPWQESFELCRRAVLLGKDEYVLTGQPFFEYVLQKPVEVNISEDDIERDDLLIIYMDVEHDLEWIELAGRLCERGCTHIMDCKYVNEFIRSPQGGGKYLRSLLWERKKWRERATAVVKANRLSSQSALGTGNE